MWAHRFIASPALLFVIVALSCGGSASRSGNTPDPNCGCNPTQPAGEDYRHDAKHVELPTDQVPQEITVDDMLGWPVSPAPPADAPRSGRELELFHIAVAYLQDAFLNPGDCDIHFEISDTADPTAKRVVVETPIGTSYCSARADVTAALAAHGIPLPAGGNLRPPIAIDVLGLAFQDYEHKRGSKYVATDWELHPAVITVH